MRTPCPITFPVLNWLFQHYCKNKHLEYRYDCSKAMVHCESCNADCVLYVARRRMICDPWRGDCLEATAEIIYYILLANYNTQFYNSNKKNSSSLEETKKELQTVVFIAISWVTDLTLNFLCEAMQSKQTLDGSFAITFRKVLNV